MKKFIFLMLFAAAGAMACDKPTAPVLPNPDKAVTAQMIKAKNDIAAYIKASELYLICVENKPTVYNKMIDEMQEAADNFNAIVRKYKARMKKS